MIHILRFNKFENIISKKCYTKNNRKLNANVLDLVKKKVFLPYD